MRRLALVFAAGAVWLFLLAIPALADNGPHVAGQNATALQGSCASCHRAHSGQAPDLLKATMPDLCYSCHGSGNAGSALDVQDGVAYLTAGGALDDSTTHAGTSGVGGGASVTLSATLGALRGGGFEYALIDTGATNQGASNGNLTTGSYKSNGQINTLTAGAQTQSRHNVGSEVNMWGSGAAGTAASYTVTTLLTCASCHDPHGNGQYRILKPTPDDSPSGVPVYINDTAAGAANKVYTTTNYGTGLTNAAGESLRNVGANSKIASLSGDGSTSTALAGSLADGSALQYVPATASTSAYFKGTYQEASNRWCSQCHQRYLSVTGSAGNKTWTEDGGKIAGSDVGYGDGVSDPTFTFRHAVRNYVDPTTNLLVGTPAAGYVVNPLGEMDPAATFPTESAVYYSQIKQIGYQETDRATGLPTGWVVSGAPYILQSASGTLLAGYAAVQETFTDLSAQPGGWAPPSSPPTFGTTQVASAVRGSMGAGDYLAGSAPRCITCHVSHGSNAVDGSFITAENPTSLVTNAALHSPLLRRDGRGVCQSCHNK